MCKIFQGTTTFKGLNKQFHPKETFGSSYSVAAPDFALTYTWDTDFRKEMPQYFSKIKAMVDENQIGPMKYSKRFKEMTFWIDIFFIDQNAKTSETLIDDLIQASNEIYSSAPHHAVFLTFDTLRRGWCLVEIGYRAFAIMNEFRLSMNNLKLLLAGKVTDNQHFSVKSMKWFSEAHIVAHRLPQIIFGDSSYLTKDLFPFMDSEILGNMRTSKKQDEHRIFEILTQLFSSESAFDAVIHEFATGGIEAVAAGHHQMAMPPHFPLTSSSLPVQCTPSYMRIVEHPLRFPAVPAATAVRRGLTTVTTGLPPQYRRAIAR
jgi:hypothetical protein